MYGGVVVPATMPGGEGLLPPLPTLGAGLGEGLPPPQQLPPLGGLGGGVPPPPGPVSVLPPPGGGGGGLPPVVPGPASLFVSTHTLLSPSESVTCPLELQSPENDCTYCTVVVPTVTVVVASEI